MPIRDIVAKMECAMSQDPTVAPVLGLTSSVKRTIRRARRQALGPAVIGSTRKDLTIPPSLLKTSSGENFLLIDDPGDPTKDERMLVFATREGLKVQKYTVTKLHVL